MLHFLRFFIFNKFPAKRAFHMCVECDKTKQTPSNKIWYDIYIRQILYKNTCSFLLWKNACLNYREFDLECDPVGVPHTWYLSAQSFITLLKLIWGEYDIVAMNVGKNDFPVLIQGINSKVKSYFKGFLLWHFNSQKGCTFISL